MRDARAKPADESLAPIRRSLAIACRLAAVFCLALAVRLTIISALLPLVDHPDEPNNDRVMLRINSSMGCLTAYGHFVRSFTKVKK